MAEITLHLSDEVAKKLADHAAEKWKIAEDGRVGFSGTSMTVPDGTIFLPRNEKQSNVRSTKQIAARRSRTTRLSPR